MSLGEGAKILRYFFISVAFLSLGGCGIGSAPADETGNTAVGGASSQNSAPTANAGSDQTAEIGTLVTLDGSGSSDPDGDALSYSWAIDVLPQGSTTALSDDTAVRPTLTPDTVGDYEMTLTVSDGTETSPVNTVTLTATEVNTPPIANAGTDQNVVTGDEVNLDGSLSEDPDGDLITYDWAFASVPEGSIASLSDASILNPTFTADIDGEFVLELSVSDGIAQSESDMVTITATTANATPVANAGADQNVVPGSLVVLDGSGSSDADGDGLLYSWSLQSVPENSTAVLDDQAAISPGFTADLEGTYVASLVVNDGIEDSTPDSVTITAATPNSIPAADAGADREAEVCEEVLLDGSGSTDADGDPLTYAWSFNSVPDGSSSQLQDSDKESSRFVPDTSGAYVARLAVSDESSTSEPDTVIISVSTGNTTASSKLRLLENVDGSLYERCLPYSSSGDAQIATSGFYCTISRFQLSAVGQDYTVTGLSVSSPNPDVSVFFSGLANNQIISAGTKVDFSLKASDTGETMAVEYNFTIAETGATFILNRELSCDTPE